MLILAIDTSIGMCSVAVTKNEKLLSYKEVKELNQQSKSLASLVESSLNDINITIDDIDYIAVNKGPGSFTGIRIGIAYVMGLKFAANKEVIGVSGFDAIKVAYQSFSQENPVVAFIDAGNNEVYYQNFSLNNYGDIGYIKISEIADKFKDYTKIGNKAVDILITPNAEFIAHAAYSQLNLKQPLQDLEPLYIKKGYF